MSGVHITEVPERRMKEAVDALIDDIDRRFVYCFHIFFSFIRFGQYFYTEYFIFSCVVSLKPLVKNPLELSIIQFFFG